MIFHIISSSEWAVVRTQGVYQPDSLATDKFIHCSTEVQVSEVANTFYNGKVDLLVLEISEEQVEAEVVYEDLYGLNQLFPHIYGRLNLNAIQKVYRLEPDDKGGFSFERQRLKEVANG
ncbi:DUF952 domain-containing protein [Paenibacillus sp. JCM 10914]|uniref:DUF952 domain-containing protein n=1 Tax=Paenibacillus sp. JCM 10914 TaxID=1236974 RepID=UPI0003CC74AB|nr:DUF952 domain-containing protein [Paenibacillus sp. JCM 10914]GAE06941.1 hypothetical protein JCM10914_3135 [Paenibacillus sp. JCM 10914]